MSEAEDIVQGARDIRANLEALVGPGWEEIDARLKELLTRADAGEAVDVEIVAELRRNAATRTWLAERLGTRRVDTYRSFPAVAGPSNPIAMPLFQCPQGDYSWRQRSVGVPIPLCPKHKVRLVQAASEP